LLIAVILVEFTNARRINRAFSIRGDPKKHVRHDPPTRNL
jgi:hypothetical protein